MHTWTPGTLRYLRHFPSPEASKSGLFQPPGRKKLDFYWTAKHFIRSWDTFSQKPPLREVYTKKLFDLFLQNNP